MVRSWHLADISTNHPMSAFGTKRTSHFALHMSTCGGASGHRPVHCTCPAFDPERTCSDPPSDVRFRQTSTVARRPPWVLTKEEGMSDDRTKADKAWEARQEAARYRIFNAATNAAEATDEADDGDIFCSVGPSGQRCRSCCRRDHRVQDLRRPVRGVGHAPQTVLARRTRRASASCRACCAACVSPKSNKIMRALREQNFSCGTQRGLSRSSPGPRPDAIAATAKLICSLGAIELQTSYLQRGFPRGSPN